MTRALVSSPSLISLAKGIPPGRAEQFACSVFPNDPDTPTPDDFPNLRQPYLAKYCRNPRRVTGRDGEQQFVVVAAVQCQLSGGFWINSARQGKFARIKQCANAARGAQSRHVARQSIRHVHHRRGQFSFRQPSSQRHSGLRVQVFPHGYILRVHLASASSQEMQSVFRLARRPAHIKEITWTRSRAQHLLSFANLSNNRNADQNSLAACCVASRQGGIERSGGAPQSPKETPQPLPCGVRRQRKIQQKAARQTTHCGDIAGRPRQAFPAHAVGRVLFAQKMGAFQEPVARQDVRESMFGPGKSRIIADSQAKFLSVARQEMPSDLLHQCVFIAKLVHTQTSS